MVVIEEKSHLKLGGRNSLFIKTEYDANIIAILKECSVYNYDAKTQVWEVPVTDLSYLLDTLVYYTDVRLKLFSEEPNPITKKLVAQHKTPLYKHQVDAVLYGLENPKWLLTDAPGLGKTLSIITLAEELKEQDKLEHCLIICGINTLKTNWEKEIAKHSHYSSIIIGKHISSKGNVSYNYRGIM